MKRLENNVKGIWSRSKKHNRRKWMMSHRIRNLGCTINTENSFPIKNRLFKDHLSYKTIVSIFNRNFTDPSCFIL